MCWFQGEDNLNGLNKKCVSRWKELNPDWQVNILSDQTISDYVSEYFDIVNNSRLKRSPQAKSDLLRILLLSKYGGVWVDASVYPMLPLSNFYNKIVNDTGFFAYRFIPRGGYGSRLCETSSWFLCVTKKNHYLIEKWKESFIKNFINYKKWPYYTFHETLTYLYDADEKIKHIINNMVQVSEKIPHSAMGPQYAHRIEDSFVYKRPDDGFINLENKK